MGVNNFGGGVNILGQQFQGVKNVGCYIFCGCWNGTECLHYWKARTPDGPAYGFSTASAFMHRVLVLPLTQMSSLSVLCYEQCVSKEVFNRKFNKFCFVNSSDLLKHNFNKFVSIPYNVPRIEVFSHKNEMTRYQ